MQRPVRSQPTLRRARPESYRQNVTCRLCSGVCFTACQIISVCAWKLSASLGLDISWCRSIRCGTPHAAVGPEEQSAVK